MDTHGICFPLSRPSHFWYGSVEPLPLPAQSKALHEATRSHNGLYMQHGVGEDISRTAASKQASEIQYCNVAHMDVCRSRDNEEAAFQILSQFMKAAGSSPLGDFEHTSVVSATCSCLPACMMM